MSTAVDASVESIANEPEANKLFRMVMKYKGSDLHLKVGLAPSHAAGRRPAADAASAAEHRRHGTADVSAAHAPPAGNPRRGRGRRLRPYHLRRRLETRFRVNLFKQRGRLSLVARRVNNKIPSFEDLHLPAVLAEITQYDQGIIILAGVTGSGKSTTIASMLQYMNERERLHIVTIEDPIEYTFKDDKSIINQREVGIDVIDWDVALKHAVRQDPDVILVGEMRDRETFSAAMHAAETGHLVFGTIHAGTAPSTVGRLLDLFPRDMHSSLRQSLAFNLKAIIAQKLLPTTKELAAKGTTRVPTNEIMRSNPDRPEAAPQRGRQQARRRHPDRQGRGDDGLHREPAAARGRREDRARDGLRGCSQPRGFENGPQGDYDRSTWYSVRVKVRQDQVRSKGRRSSKGALPAGRRRAATRLRSFRAARALGRTTWRPARRCWTARLSFLPPLCRRARGHASKKGLLMIRPFLVLATFLAASSASCAGADAAELLAPILAQSPNMSRGPGFYLNLYKFVPVVADLPALDLDHRLGRARHQGAEQRQVRALEQRHLLLRSARAAPDVRHPDLPAEPGPAAAGLPRADPDLLVCSQPDRARRPEGPHALPPGRGGQRPVAEAGHAADVQQGRDARSTGPARRSRSSARAAGTAKEDPNRVRQAEESRSFMAAKELVYDAVLRRATDIHLEPTTEQLSVRYRIDGILHAAEPFDRPTGDAVINVFKVLSAMDISEKRKPQDGSFGAKLQARDLDFRVATSGSKAGEKLVMRILDNSAGSPSSKTWACGPSWSSRCAALVTQPHGMFLCCGPTGSGKSTTLYACLREIDRYQRNIITVEDPIEYHMDNITQMEVNTKAGQTFATSLRSILRQDPDVIMIGEIRDQETATIACQAANTGHMVFSTVHSNDAVTASVPAARPGRRAVHDLLGADRRAGPAAGARALRGLQGAVQAQARVPQEGQPAGRQGRRLLPPAREPRAGLPAVRRDRLLRPHRDLSSCWSSPSRCGRCSGRTRRSTRSRPRPARTG